jgi:hypothetical protein
MVMLGALAGLLLAASPAALAARRDNTPPTVSLTAPAGGASVSGAVPVTATASDNLAVDHVTFRVDGVAMYSDFSAPIGLYGFSWDTTKVPSGSHVISARAADTSGNTSPLPDPQVIVTVGSVDTTPPDTVIDSGPSSGTSTEATLAFHSTQASSSFECRLDDGSWAPCVSPKSYSNLSIGSHTFYVRATDAAGNTDQSPASRSWTIQTSSGCAAVATWVRPQIQQASNRYLYTPLSDSQAAACVQHVNEAVSANVTANSYVPSDSQLAAFHNALDNYGKTPDQEWYYTRYVTGRSGLSSPSTDDLIQWASHKWGIPEDWLRGQAVQESDWRQAALGDLRTETSADWTAYHNANPTYCPNSRQCYESVGIMQDKWQPPPRDEGAGTEPLRWYATAFNLDYTAATERFYHDNPYGLRSAWGDASYQPLDDWLSICAHFSPYPWNNSGQQSYCTSVKSHVAARDWPKP